MDKPQAVEHALPQVPVKINTCCLPNLTSILNMKGSEPDGFGCLCFPAEPGAALQKCSLH